MRSRAALLVMLLVLGLVPSAWAAAGVSTLTGNYSYDRVDLAMVASPRVITFARAYNSFDARTTTLGPGWTHNFAMRVRPTQNAHQVAVVGPRGRSDVYVEQTDG